MRDSLYGDSLGIAVVFISHSWKDNELTDFLFNVLTNHFYMYYDRSSILNRSSARGMLAGETLVPDKQIPASDVFLFAASSHSVSRNSRAIRELEIARNLPAGCAPVVIFVVLEDFTMPSHLSTHLYLQLKRSTQVEDSEHIVQQIKSVLINRGGLYHWSTPDDTLLVGGKDPERILEILTSEYKQGLYAMNIVFPYAEMHRIADVIKRSEEPVRVEVMSRLIEIFVTEHDSPRTAVARQNAIILASKIMPGEKDLIAEFNKRWPDFPMPFLYRGFHVALGAFGDHDIAIEYALGLERGVGTAWDSQRYINRRFHLDYYGGLAPTLQKIRQSLHVLEPTYLLAINVFTLGDLSNDLGDVELIDRQKSELRNRKVPSIIIDNAIQRIIQRYRSDK
jgi:hypothetical protein